MTENWADCKACGQRHRVGDPNCAAGRSVLPVVAKLIQENFEEHCRKAGVDPEWYRKTFLLGTLFELEPLFPEDKDKLK